MKNMSKRIQTYPTMNLSSFNTKFEDFQDILFKIIYQKTNRKRL